MGILLSKNLKQKQSIKLTPSLKKSIDLLQLSRFELIKKIENEIIENPFLEKQDIDYDQSFNAQDFDFEIESKITLREKLIDQLNDFDFASNFQNGFECINDFDFAPNFQNDLEFDFDFRNDFDFARFFNYRISKIIDPLLSF